MTAVDAAVARYQTVYGRIRAETVAQIVALWAAFGGLTDADADRFVAAAVPAVTGAQTAVARLVAGYVATITRLALDEPAVAASTADIDVGSLRGVDAAEVYRRPVVAARTAISEGQAFDQAMSVARTRAEQLADTDVAMAQRQATIQSVGADERIVGYRRVLTGRSCAFCATASTQRYRRAQLMPLHSRCDCGVAPIFGTADPGQIINRRLLRDIKATAKQGGSSDYWDSRHFTVGENGEIVFPEVAVHDHGELGPVLTAAADHFTGPGGIAA